MARLIKDIAYDITKDWGKKVSYSAKPYLNAMWRLNTIEDKDFLDGAEDIIRRFLANASTYRGETAKRLKNELKSLLK